MMNITEQLTNRIHNVYSELCNFSNTYYFSADSEQAQKVTWYTKCGTITTYIPQSVLDNPESELKNQIEAAGQAFENMIAYRKENKRSKDGANDRKMLALLKKAAAAGLFFELS